MPVGFFRPSAIAAIPHPPIPLAVHLVTEAAVCAAWQGISESRRPGFDLESALEDEITLELRETLFDRIYRRGMVPGFGPDLFRIGYRGASFRDYLGRSINKMPDLRVHLVDRPPVGLNTQDGLCVECSPVDPDHPAGGCYCDAGLIRFVCGEYAWATTSATMIGYVRPNYSVDAKLTPALRQRVATLKTLDFPSPCGQSRGADTHEVVTAPTGVRIS